MKHFASAEFWHLYEQLPETIQRLADKNFELLKNNPTHRSLRLKKVNVLWSVRVGLQYRALAKVRSEGLVWFWIGHHRDYDQLLKQ